MCTQCIQYPWRAEEDMKPWTEVIDGCKLPCGCRELNPNLVRAASALNGCAITPAPVVLIIGDL